MDIEFLVPGLARFPMNTKQAVLRHCIKRF